MNKEYQDKIWQFLDKDLDPNEELSFQTSIKEDDTFRLEFQRAQQLDNLLRAHVNQKPSSDQIMKWEKAVAGEFEVINAKLWTRKELFALTSFIITGLILVFYLFKAEWLNGWQSNNPSLNSSSYIWVSFILGGGLLLFVFDAMMKNRITKHKHTTLRIF